MTIEQIAQVAHELNKAYCESIGDTLQPSWADAPEWQKSSAINGVKFHLENPNAGPDASHNSWLKQKKEEGWKYGPVKNADTKEHPCFVPYDHLPVQQQTKDYLFRQVIHSLKGSLTPSAQMVVGEIEPRRIVVDLGEGTEKTVNYLIKLSKERGNSEINTNEISDGYHTFGELYEHRITLFIVLARETAHNPKRHTSHPVWRSQRHSDGELAFGGGWFVLGIGKKKGQQITYHLPMTKWDDAWFAETLDMAPEFDGHTSADVLERLAQL